MERILEFLIGAGPVLVALIAALIPGQSFPTQIIPSRRMGSLLAFHDQWDHNDRNDGDEFDQDIDRGARGVL